MLKDHFFLCVWWFSPGCVGGIKRGVKKFGESLISAKSIRGRHIMIYTSILARVILRVKNILNVLGLTIIPDSITSLEKF